MTLREQSDNLNDSETAESKNCSVCKDLLNNMGRFFDMLETARRSFTSDWLTVDEIAAELKISKSIVYRLIRNGELEAVDIIVIDDDSKIAKKGHYRINKSALNKYLESKKVKSLPNQVTHPSRPRHLQRLRIILDYELSCVVDRTVCLFRNILDISCSHLKISVAEKSLNRKRITRYSCQCCCCSS